MADLNEHVRYLDSNPVKARLALHPAEYLWSSASGRYAMDSLPQGLKPRREGSEAASSGTAEAVP
jgi:hypothetical protein